MKNNYPIKYALVPMFEKTDGYNDEIVCYIVSKCYLVNENKEYNENGNIKKSYNVVCPYNKDFYSWVRQEPRFNFGSGSCTNSIITNDIFDNYEDAIKLKNEKNNEIFYNQLSYLSCKELQEKRNEIEKKFNEQLSYYNQLETLIDSKTKDLQVNAINKEQSTIINYKNKLKKYNFSLYRTFNLFSDDNFIVYSLTKDEYYKLKDLNSNDLDKLNYNPLLINDKESKIKKIIAKNKEEKYLNKDNIIDVANDYKGPNVYDMIIYTMEDYDDIINSYKNNDEICIKEILKLVKK